MATSPREPMSRRERRVWLLALSIVAVIGMALRWEAVAIGQLSDDYMQHAMIAGLYPGDGYAPFDLYAFFRSGQSVAEHVEQGTLPWFAEPAFHGAVLRPLASLLLWLDHVLAPGQVRLWHFHSLLWFAATLVSFGMAARRLLPRWPAVLAVAMLVCEAGFVSPLGWLANRCVLVAAAFGFAAIFVHIEWRRPDPETPNWLRRRGPIIEAALVLLSLGGGEYALGVFALLFGWELMVGSHEASGWRARSRVAMRALLPSLIPVVVYLAVHKLSAYGTFGADVYADPINHPLGWLRWAKLRIPTLATAALWGVPASTLLVFRHPGGIWWFARWPTDNPVDTYISHMWFGMFGIGLAAVLLLLARAGLHQDERRLVRAMLLGGGLGLLPISVAPSHERLLIVSQLAACTIVCLATLACVRLLLGRAPQQPPRVLTRLGGAAMLPLLAVLLSLQTVADLRWSDVYLEHLDALQASDAAAFTEGNLLEQELEGRDVIVLNGASQSVAMYGPFVLHANGMPVPNSWRSLALGGDHAIWVFRTADDTLELAAIRGAWLQTAGELFFRRLEHHLRAGDTFDYPTLDIEILSDTDGDPTRVRFRFAHSLDDPRYLFLVSTKQGLMRFEMPPVWGSTVIPRPAQPYVGTREVLFVPPTQGPKG
jgi:hypothetical protein